MTLHLADFPLENSETAAWLDAKIVSDDLGDLVAELLAFRGDDAPSENLDAVLGAERSAVLEQGLPALNSTTLRSLLRRPTLLLNLQELVLLEGGLHWQDLLEQRAELKNSVAVGWTSLRSAEPKAEYAAPASKLNRRRWIATFALAVAAVLVVGIAPLFWKQEATTVAWGWAKPGALPQDLPAGEYLRTLADAGDQWFKRRPQTPAELGKRIDEFIQGCEVLIAAEHRPLAPIDRDWLRERCRKWQGDLQAIRKTDDPAQKLSAALEKADAVAARLVNALRDRAVKAAT